MVAENTKGRAALVVEFNTFKFVAFVAFVADVADVAVLAFPVKFPVIPEVTVRVFNDASDPDVMTFFQFGILQLLY